MESFQARILAADRIFYEGPCLSMTVPTSDGELGILARHASMIAAVRPGTLRFQPPEQPVQAAAISPGMVKVEGNEVLVLVDSIERPEEIDAARAGGRGGPGGPASKAEQTGAPGGPGRPGPGPEPSACQGTGELVRHFAGYRRQNSCIRSFLPDGLCAKGRK